MKAVLDFFEQGGPVVIGIALLSLILYSSCFDWILGLWKLEHSLRDRSPEQMNRERLVHLQETLQDQFHSRRASLAGMIAAAPLLGLLGTVSGMSSTFEVVSQRGDTSKMDGLAKGISEVLVATESGLAVAIPAALLVYYAHRRMQKTLSLLSAREAACARRI